MQAMGVIHGSDRPHRFCEVAAGWSLAQRPADPDPDPAPFDPLALRHARQARPCATTTA